MQSTLTVLIVISEASSRYLQPGTHKYEQVKEFNFNDM